MQEIYISKNDANMRLDRFLKKFLPQARPSVLYKGIRKKNILLNEKKAREDTIIREGDRVQIYFKDKTIEAFKGQEAHLQDLPWPDIRAYLGPILIMDKPAGLLSQPAQEGDDSLVGRLKAYARDQGLYDPSREKTFAPAICNRLDRNTSGLVIGALSAQALRDMNQAVKERKVKRYYLALVEGLMEEGVDLASRLKKDSSKNLVSEDEKGKEALASYRPLATGGGLSLVEVDLITGRTHQIRAQLASLGHPILGDRKYGNGQENHGLTHQALHAYRLAFPAFEGVLAPLSGQGVISWPGGDFARLAQEALGDWKIF